MNGRHEAPVSRINARLDESRASKLDFLKRITGLSVSEIVKRGIDALYDEEQRRAADARRILADVGFVGCASGPEDLSVRYKDELRESLEEKHGHR